ncbi:MAG: tetratricopeptide repeat protein [Candidatus Latescibacteria bacterium]|nr:tetratricopeptide repeat protein [Candidatus Latescibacterota bacterium]
MSYSPLFAVPVGQLEVLADRAVSTAALSPFGPLYGFALAMARDWVFSGYLALKSVQVGIGAVNCVLVWQISRKAFGSQVGLIAGLWAVFYVPSFYWEGQLSPAVWTGTCILGGLACLGADRCRPLAAGLLLGLAGGLGGFWLGLGLAIVGWRTIGRERGGSAGAWLLAGFLAGFLASYLPGAWLAGDWAQLAAATRPDPAQWPQGLYLFWHGSELHSQGDPYLTVQQAPAASILLWHRFIAFPFGLVGPLALMGLWSLGRQSQRPIRQSLLLWGTVAAVAGALLQGGGAEGRSCTAPLLLVIAALACIGLCKFWDQRRRLVLRGGALIVLAFLCNAGSGPIQAVANQLYWRGQAFEQLDMKANATREYERAVAHGTAPAAHGALARLYEADRDFNRSLKHYEQVVRLQPADRESKVKLARIYLQAERPRRAAQMYEILSRDDTENLFLGRLGDALLMAGDSPGALRAYEAMSVAHPDSGRVLYNLARLYESEGFKEEALGAYRQLGLHAQWGIEAHWRAAALLAERGDREEAEELLGAALAVEPDNRPVLWGLGRLLAVDGRYAEALTVFENLRDLDPENYQTYFFLSKLYFRLGLNAEAEGAYETYQIEKKRAEIRQSVEENLDSVMRQFGELGE